jgi:hypothetical protein
MNRFDEYLKKEKTKKTRHRPRHEEHDLQSACVRWFDHTYPELKMLLFAVPNGGWRTESTAAKLKEEGVRAGVADLILAIETPESTALCIEMKTAEGRQSATQKAWQQCIERHTRMRYVVCRSLEDFMSLVQQQVIKMINHS